MPQSYLIFDFAGNEEGAQQALHRVDAWKQAFRLGRKLELRFDRPVEDKAGKSGEAGSAGAPARLRLIVRLDFSDHERLSHVRWLERIPADAPFRGLSVEIIRAKDEGFATIEALFESLK